jgi:hypothetical protein
MLGLRTVFCHLVAHTAHGEDERGDLLARHGLTLKQTASAPYWAFP